MSLDNFFSPFIMATNSALPFSHLGRFGDEEFAVMLYEHQNGPVHFDHGRLFIRSDHIDPDAHVKLIFRNIDIRCDYR